MQAVGDPVDGQDVAVLRHHVMLLHWVVPATDDLRLERRITHTHTHTHSQTNTHTNECTQKLLIVSDDEISSVGTFSSGH